MFVTLLPLLYLCNTAKHPPYPDAMCGVDLTTMRQLLADQRRDLIKDMKEQIVCEVATQLAPHTARLDKLQNDQNLLQKQLSDITNRLKQRFDSNSCATSNTLPSLSPVQAPCGPTFQGSPNSSALDLPSNRPDDDNSLPTTLHNVSSAIEAAKRTLYFHPVPSDLTCMMNHPSESVSRQILLERVLTEYMETKLSIPPHIIFNMAPPLSIHHNPYKNVITVVFSNLEPVRTVFSHVKNLPPTCKVSLSIPHSLRSSYQHLKSKAYHLRNGTPRQKTVIKYQGNCLALFARPVKPDNSSWQLVSPAPSDVSRAALPHGLPSPSPPPGEKDLTPKNFQIPTMS